MSFLSGGKKHKSKLTHIDRSDHTIIDNEVQTREIESIMKSLSITRRKRHEYTYNCKITIPNAVARKIMAFFDQMNTPAAKSARIANGHAPTIKLATLIQVVMQYADQVDEVMDRIRSIEGKRDLYSEQQGVSMTAFRKVEDQHTAMKVYVKVDRETDEKLDALLQEASSQMELPPRLGKPAILSFMIECFAERAFPQIREWSE
jgi:hypothetical protein